WTEEGEPYVLTGDVKVPGGGKLVIDPGVKVMPTGNYGIISKYNNPYWHRIYAQGTALNKILFTPHRKLYPETDSIPKGFWKGIDFHTANWEDSLIFDHCLIEGAGSDSAGFWVYMAKYVSLTNCEISKSGGFGFYCDYRCSNVSVYECQFTNNDSIPLVAPFKFIGEIYGNGFVNNKPNVIGIRGGTRNTDATIDNQGVPYWFLKGEFIVESTNDAYCPVLTIQAGVKIFFHDSSGLYLGVYPSPMRAKILAQGTADSIIIFSALDTTKHWRGIHIADNNIADTSKFEYCEISYGGRILNPWFDRSGGNIGFLWDHTPYIIRNSSIGKSLNSGCGNFHVTSGRDSLVSIIKNNVFYENDSFPLYLGANELGECEGNAFINNGINAILVKGERIDHSIAIKNQGVPYVVHWYWNVINVDGRKRLATLEIEKGNIMQFGGGAILVGDSGVVRAKGVTFTAPDTIWAGIKFDYANADTSILDSCHIEKAGFYSVGGWPYGAIHLNGSRVRISNSSITNNEKGLWLAYQNRLNLTGNLIAQNRCGIYRASSDFNSDSILINTNQFIGNKIAIQNTNTNRMLNADSNWW
ncbi:MAG: right-handed parallel beta-helix repeat-containing protein, partial [bacterium]